MRIFTRGIGLAGLVALMACDEGGVDPITRITAPRVLAVTTEPSVLQVDGELELTAITVDPDGPRIGGRPVDVVRMRACPPWKFIADPGRDCSGDDALVLLPDAAGRVVASAAALSSAFPSPPGVSAPPDPWRAALAAGLELQVPIIVEVEVDGRTLVARRYLDVVDAPTSRQNPRIAEIRFDGVATQTLRAGQRYALTVTFDRASLDEHPRSESPGALEKVDSNFYSPAGELAEPEADVEEPDALVPETKPNAYTAGAPGSTWLFVVATDETGGMTVAAMPLSIE
jgi:hypothetical protein